MDREKELLEALKETIISGEAERAEKLAKEAVKEGIDPLLALEEGLSKGISIVGDAFGAGEAFLPELITAAAAMKAGTKVFVEELKKAGIERKSVGKVVIGTAVGDVHDIGKTLVATMLAVNGFEIYDIGTDNPAEKFVEAVRQYKPDIVGISALLTTAMVGQRDVLEALAEFNLRSKVKVIVGGGPVTVEWAEKVGADAYAVNAVDAVLAVKSLMGIEHEGGQQK